MTLLKSNITNDIIRYEIKVDYVDFEVIVLNNKKELLKLIKFLLIKLKEENCDFPINIKMNDYKIPKNMKVGINDIHDNLYRFLLTVEQADFRKLFKVNFEKSLMNKYDLKVDWHDRIEHTWNNLKTDNEHDYITFDCNTHPFATIFRMYSMTDPEVTINFIEKMINILRKANIVKPFKFRLNNSAYVENFDHIMYDTTRKNTDRDYLIKFDDFLNFFKKNIIYFVEMATVKYNIDVEQPEADDDGWTVAVNTKKVKSKAHAIAKTQLYEKLIAIQESVSLTQEMVV